MARVTGQRSSSTLPLVDTPRVAGTFPAHGDPADSAQSTRSAWRSVTPSIAGTPHIRISRDDGRTYPARHARPLPAEAPGQPCTVPVYDAGSASGRLLALDVDPAARRLSTARPPELGQLLAAPRCPVRRRRGHVDRRPPLLILFAAALPWLELRDLCRAIAPRFPVVDPAPMCSLGGQISPPGSRAKRGGWRLLSTPVDSPWRPSSTRTGRRYGPRCWTSSRPNCRRSRTAGETQQVDAELDDTGVLWVPRPGGRAKLGAELERAARTGTVGPDALPGPL